MAKSKAAPEVKAMALPAMPDDAALAEARATRKAAGTQSEMKPGQVLGLPDGWVAAKIDPALDDGRKAVLRAKYKAKGWLALDGLQQVVGYPLGCEVWVKPAGDYEQARADHGDKMRELARSGLVILGAA